MAAKEDGSGGTGTFILDQLNLELDADVAELKRELYIVIGKARNLNSVAQKTMVVRWLEEAYHSLDEAQVKLTWK